MLEEGGSGPYNAVGAEDPYRAKPFLEGLIDATGSQSTLTWVDWKWLRNVESNIPSYGPWYGAGPISFMQINNDRALATGLTFRPIAETAKDMIAKFPERGFPERWRGGLDLSREAAVLQKWHAEG